MSQEAAVSGYYFHPYPRTSRSQIGRARSKTTERKGWTLRERKWLSPILATTPCIRLEPMTASLTLNFILK